MGDCSHLSRSCFTKRLSKGTFALLGGGHHNMKHLEIHHDDRFALHFHQRKEDGCLHSYVESVGVFHTYLSTMFNSTHSFSQA